MEYLDEDILTEIVDEELKQQVNNNDTFTLEGIEYTMIRHKLFNYQFSLLLPEHFFIMENDMLYEKYPSNDRPQLVYTDRNGSINITFSLLDTPTTKDDLDYCIKGLKQAIKRIYPANTFYDMIVDIERIPAIASFDYRSNALDDEIYNKMFVMAIHRQLLLGTFNCKFSKREELSLLGDKMILSIQEVEKEEDENE